MIAPRVHMNGTSRKSLLESIIEASQTISLAIGALRNTAPHGRDYYVISDIAYVQARAEYEARLTRLHETNKELIAMYRAIEQNEIEFTTEVK